MKINPLFDAISETDEKYIKESEQKFASQNRKENVFRVLKPVAAAASVVLICAFAVFMWIIAEKHRDPVASTDTTPGTAAVTAPETDVPVTDEQTATDTVTDVMTEMTTDLPEEDFETEVKKMLSDYKSKESKSFLFKSENVSPAFDIAAKVYSDQSANEILRDNAAHFIYDVMREDRTGDLLFYNGEYHWGLSSGDVGRPYILLLDHYLDAAKKAAEGLSAECVKTRAYRTYSLLCASGYEFYKPGDTESRIVDIYERALTLYNAVWGGKPIIDGNTVKITKPYPPELEAAVKEYWGDTDRAFYTSETLDEETFRTLCNGVYVSTASDMLIMQGKYFTVINGRVYMTAADENDNEAEPYFFTGLKYFKYYDSTKSASAYAFRTDKNGVEASDRLRFYDMTASSEVMPGCDLTYGLVCKRGDSAIDYLIDLVAKTGVSAITDRDGLVKNAAYRMMENEMFAYIAENYPKETSEARRAAMSSIILQKAEEETYEIFLYSGTGEEEIMAYHKRGYEINKMSQSELAEWLKEYTEAASSAAKKLYEEDVKEHYPATYLLLQSSGFRDYRSGPYSVEYQSQKLIKKLAQLFEAVYYGAGLTDETSLRYGITKEGDVEEKIIGWPDEIKGLIEKYSDDPKSGSSAAFIWTQRQGLKTVGEWYTYFSDVLPEKDVRAFIGDGNALFMIDDDGTVYTHSYYPEWGIAVYERTARIVEEKDGYTVIGFLVDCPGHMEDEVREFTVNVKVGKNGLYIDGGSFIDVFMKKNITRYDAASALSDILRMHALIYSGDIDAAVYRSANLVDLAKEGPFRFDGKEDLPDYLSDHAPDVYPVYGFSLYSSIHFEDFVSDAIFNKMTEDSGCFKRIDMTYCFITPSLVKVTNTAKACENGDYSIHNIEKALKNVSVKGDKMTVSLDFVRTENGKSASKTYTFEFEYKDGKAVLTGGTFVTECLKK